MPRGAARPAIDPGGEDAGDERPVGRPIPRHHGTPGGLFVDEFLRFHEAYICLLKSRYTPKLAVKAHPSSRRKPGPKRSEEHTSELQSLMRRSYAVFCLKTKKKKLTQK